MKKKIIVLLAVIIILGIVFSGCAANNNTVPQNGENTNTSNQYTQNETATEENSSISKSDAEGLIFTVEEEKLARDVYTYLYNRWHLNVFKNIMSAEQTHMDAVSALISKYNLDNPTDGEKAGAFQNEEIQHLYDSLTAEGSKSKEDALIVGAKIEEIDIRDIEDKISKTDNTNIQPVYRRLTSGSENHLRAFVSNLKNYGISYSPNYLSQEQFDSIINASNGKGPK
jgi:hypothetical protein